MLGPGWTEVVALVAALTAALAFAAIALSLVLARMPSEPPPPLPNVLTARAMAAPTSDLF